MKALKFLVVALVIAIAAPALASISSDDEDSSIDDWLRARLVSAGDEQLTILVHAARSDIAASAASASGLRVIDQFESVGVAVAVGDSRQIEAVSKLPEVAFVEGNRPIEFFLTTSNVATRGDEARRGFPGSPGVDGSGISIAIVDSGIDGTHPMFQQGGQSRVRKNIKLACQENTPVYIQRFPPSGPFPPSNCNSITTEWVDVTNAGNNTDDMSLGGHGTHVAGIAGGGDVATRDGRMMHGAAPGASLIGISIGASLSIYGGGKGLEWVLQNHASPCSGCPPIRVVNNSWGVSGGGDYDPRDFISKVQEQLVAQGIVVVWANGNSGGEGSDNRSSIHGQSPTPGIISVANYDDVNVGDRNGLLAPSSSRGRKGEPETYPDVSAPGTLITSACRLTLTICQSGLFLIDGDDPDYATISGTSMAAPHVAGIVAQLLQANSVAAPEQIENNLEDTAHKFTAGGRYEPDTRNHDSTTSSDKGHGLVDVVSAVARIRNVLGTEAVDHCGMGPMILDEEGDATGYAFVERSSTLESEPGLDILSGNMKWGAGATSTSTFIDLTIVLKELGTPGASIGSIYDFYFSHEGQEVRVTTHRSLDGEYSYSLTGPEGPAANEVTGSVNEEMKSITIRVPTNAVTPAVTPDTKLKDARIWTRKDQAPVAPVVDRAPTKCIFQGRVIPNPGDEPEPEVSPPIPGVTITVDDPIDEWRGEPTTNSADLLGCDGFYEDERECEKRYVEVIPAPPGGDLLVSITGDNPADDYDLYVYGPDGTEIARSAAPFGIESVRFQVPTRALYTIEVRAYLTVEGNYSGVAELQELASPPAGLPTITMDDAYSWSGTIPLASTYFGCLNAEDPACDNERIYIDAPDGGGRLTLRVASTDPESRDIDLALFDARGERMASSATEWGEEKISILTVLDGVYTVSSSSFFYPGLTYEGRATITCDPSAACAAVPKLEPSASPPPTSRKETPRRPARARETEPALAESEATAVPEAISSPSPRLAPSPKPNIALGDRRDNVPAALPWTALVLLAAGAMGIGYFLRKPRVGSKSNL